MQGQSVFWEPAPDIAEVFGEKPTELAVIFLHDDPREVCPSEYALWTRKGRLCHGELVQIANGNTPRYECRQSEGQQSTRRGIMPGNHKYVDGPMKGQPIEGCGEGCPELESGKCGPSADLYFILEQFLAWAPSAGFTRGARLGPQFVERRGATARWNGGRLKWSKPF